MVYQTLKYEVDQRVLTLTLNRPEQLNAFTVQMAEELVAAFEQASDDDEVGAIIVTGAGRAFCAGMDLSSDGNVFGLDESLRPTMADMKGRLEDPSIEAGVRDTGGRVTLAIFRCKKPVIAAVNGAAVGIGATMTLAMDLRLASEKARVGFVFGKLGVVPEACSSWFLPRLVGPQQALEWMLSAEIFDAEDGKRGGLFRSVHAPDALMPAARALAHKFIDGRSPVAVALTRQMILRNAVLPHPIEAHRVDSLGMFLHQHRRRERGRRSLSREARTSLYGPGLRHAALLSLDRRGLIDVRRLACAAEQAAQLSAPPLHPGARSGFRR